MRGRPIRSPWPFDIVINGVGYMLGAPEKGAPLVATKPPDLTQAAPPEFGYNAAHPSRERTMAYIDLTLGLGQKMQQTFTDRRYRYGICLDASTSIIQKGPAITTLTPATTDATNGVSKFFEIGGHLYALTGRYCLVRTDDTAWGVSKDFTSGKVATDVVTFYNASGANLAYVAMGDSELFYKFTGATTTTTWTQHGSLYARAFAVAGNEIYRGHTTNLVTKAVTNGDPWDAAAWATGDLYYIGDQNTGVTRLVIGLGNVLFVLKSDGVYSVTRDDAIAHNLFPYLSGADDAYNGKGNAQWLNDVYVSYRDGTFRIAPDFTIEEVGPERITDNDSPVKGRITAMAGHDTFCLYGGIYDPDTGDSYLLKFGAWITSDPRTPRAFLGAADGDAKRIDAWHGSISQKFASKKITALYRATTGNHGAPSGHSRMFIGFSDGSVGWFTLPCMPNPAACSSYTYTTTDGQLFLPTFTGNFSLDLKALKSFSVTGLNLSSAIYASLKYRTDPTSTYLTLSGNYDAGQTKRIEFPATTAGQVADLQVVLTSTGGVSPQITAMGLAHAVRPDLLLDYQFLALCDDKLLRRDGTPIRANGSQMRDTLKLLAQAPSVTVTLPDETQKELSVVEYTETQGWDERLRAWKAAVQLTGTEFKTSKLLGTHERLGAYTHGALAVFTHNQLQTL